MPQALETTPIRVLLIDDDREDYLITKGLFEDLPDQPFVLDWVPTYEDGLKAICDATHDVYLVDYRLGARDGLQLLREAREHCPHASLILLTGQGQYEVDRRAIEAGAADYLEKNRLDSVLLERSIRHALLQQRYSAELERTVRERTADLERSNQNLIREIAVRAEAEEALREVGRRKDEFLGTLAHELRNPLAPIRNALEIMRLTGDKPEAVARARTMMDRQVGHMVRLIDDLLDISRITRGKLNLSPERVPLSEVIDAALELSKPQIEKAKLSLEVKLPNREVLMTVDRMRVAQLLSNLLNNSAKYTESGGSVVLACALDDGHVQISVKDTGVGIPAEHLPQVFELFTQIDRTLNRSQGGLGIGLALVRRLVEMHRGTVTAHSDGPRRGATFTVRLPIDPA